MVPPGLLPDQSESRPVGLAAIAGGLADWDELDDVVTEIYRARRRSRDRVFPDLA